MKELNPERKVETIQDPRERRNERKLQTAMRHPAQIVDWDEYEYGTTPHFQKPHRLSRK